MEFCEIKPFIRYAQRIHITERSSFFSCTAYDHRFFYCADGNGFIRVEDTVYPMQKGCIMLWKSGLNYDIICEKGGDMFLFGFNFDYTYANSFLTAPIPPSFGEFKKSDALEQVSFSDAPSLNSVVHLNNMHLLENDISAICNEYVRHVTYHQTRMTALFAGILCETVREMQIKSDTMRRSRSKVEEILKYISDHYKESITNELLGAEFGYHPNYINHLVVQHTGMSLHKYLLSFRINKAIDLLQTTDLPVAIIAEHVGFSDYNHFLKYFKQSTGYTTKSFRGK